MTIVIFSSLIIKIRSFKLSILLCLEKKIILAALCQENTQHDWRKCLARNDKDLAT